MSKAFGAAFAIAQVREHLDWLSASCRDLELQDFVSPEVLGGNWQSRVKEYRDLLHDYPGRYGIHGPFRGLPMDSEDPEIRKVVQARLEQGLKIAEALGASHMVVHSPMHPWLERNLEMNESNEDALFDRFHATLKDAVKQAENSGCTLMLENTRDIVPHRQVELMESFGSAAIRISVDVGHAFCMHVMDAAPPPDYWLRHAGPMLGHVHLQDTDGYADRHWLPGEGLIRWQSVLASLGKHEGVRKIIEVKDKTGVKKTAAWLEHLCQDA